MAPASLVVLDAARGQIVAGTTAVPVLPAGPGGELRVGGPDGPVLRPLTFGERDGAAAQAAATARQRENLGAAVLGLAIVSEGTEGRSAGSGEPARATGEAEPAPPQRPGRVLLEVVALFLAGAGQDDAPPFAEAALLVARAAGWDPGQLAAAQAAEVDRLAAHLAGRRPADSRSEIRLVSGPDEELEVIRDELATGLLARAGAGEEAGVPGHERPAPQPPTRSARSHDLLQGGEGAGDSSPQPPREGAWAGRFSPGGLRMPDEAPPPTLPRTPPLGTGALRFSPGRRGDETGDQGQSSPRQWGHTALGAALRRGEEAASKRTIPASQGGEGAGTAASAFMRNRETSLPDAPRQAPIAAARPLDPAGRTGPGWRLLSADAAGAAIRPDPGQAPGAALPAARPSSAWAAGGAGSGEIVELGPAFGPEREMEGAELDDLLDAIGAALQREADERGLEP